MGSTKPATRAVINSLISHIRSYANLPEGVKVFAYEREKKCDADYVVVNNLPFAQSRYDVMQAVINVNVHAKDNLKGNINRTKMDAMVDKITELFMEDTELEGNWFSLSSVSMPYQDEDSTHFVNIKITCNYSNF